MKLFLSFIFSTCTIFAFDVEVVNATVSNGKTALLEFKKEKNISYENIEVDKKRYKIFDNPVNGEKFYALIPISYEEKPNDKKVEVFYKEAGKEKSKIISLSIKDAKYEKETLSVDSSKVTLSEEDQQRASKEYADAMKIYSRATQKSYMTSDFIVPMDSKITSDFGKARVYNNTLKSYHGGTDFRAPLGTPFLASNNGKVVLVQDRFYSGGSVIIDHGHGIYSCYFHMSKFGVKEGEDVKRGDVIGLSGDTGRVSGPHLHFGIRIGGEQVDPLHFIELINKNLLKGTQ